MAISAFRSRISARVSLFWSGSEMPTEAVTRTFCSSIEIGAERLRLTASTNAVIGAGSVSDRRRITKRSAPIRASESCGCRKRVRRRVIARSRASPPERPIAVLASRKRSISMATTVGLIGTPATLIFSSISRRSNKRRRLANPVRLS